MKTIAQLINEDAAFWIRQYTRARADYAMEPAQYGDGIALYTIRLLCDHGIANWISHNCVYCKECKAQVFIPNHGR